MNVISTHDRFRGVPAFFRGLCRDARSGGRGGYKAAGHELARHVGDLVEGDGPEVELEELAGLLFPRSPDDPKQIAYVRRDDEAVWAWFQREFPRCMDLVPTRRRGKFLEGVYQAADDEGGVFG